VVTAPAGGTALVARLDNAGDVLLAGPAVRAVAARADEVVLLAGPHGRSAAELLPGVDRVLEWRAPWIDPEPAAVTPEHVAALTAAVRAEAPVAALLLTSFHQSALPLALLLRLAGVGWIGAISEDYPGVLLDLRHRVEGDPPEAERALSLARAAGYRLPVSDDGRLAVRRPLPDVSTLTGAPGYVVLHPGASVPARAWPAECCAQAVHALAAAGYRVLVTGAPGVRTASTWAGPPTCARWPRCSTAPARWWSATPAPHISPRRWAPRWSRCSPRWCRPPGGLPTGCRSRSSATRMRRAAAPGPGTARCRATPASPT
jgi:ADP-heptose:LPS heptosyltransferase